MQPDGVRGVETEFCERSEEREERRRGSSGRGRTIESDETASRRARLDMGDIKKVLFPIFDSFPLNTTKYLDYLSFKEALLLNLSSKYEDKNSQQKYIDKILDLKHNMNKNRKVFNWSHLVFF